mgnify:FL=1
MGAPTKEQRIARFRAWWDGLNADQQAHAIKSGHARIRFPEAQQGEGKTPNQRKAERRRARGKR